MIKKEIKYPKWWVVLIGASLYIGISYWDNRERERYRRDFISLRDSTNMNGVITDYYTVMVWAGTSAIELSNGQNFLISDAIFNKQYSPSSFYDLVEVGDSIKKTTGADTLYLYKKKENYKEYYFF